MYEKHFHLASLPFHLTPDANFYYELPSHQLAFNAIMISLKSGEGLVKIIGEVGSGKTILCQRVKHAIENDYPVICLSHCDLSADELRRAVAFELQIDTANMDTHVLLRAIEMRLLALHDDNRRPVFLLDEAQSLSDESLEALRLLTNLEKNGTRLLQVVLFGQPELEQRLKQHHLRQLTQRINFSCYLSPIHQKDLTMYLCHRLSVAGCTYGSLFTKRAKQLLYRFSRGLPRIVNVLSHKSMMVAYGRGEPIVDAKAMWLAILDTDFVYRHFFRRTIITIVILTLLIVLPFAIIKLI